jgi:DNA mismatch repair protein MSH2
MARTAYQDEYQKQQADIVAKVVEVAATYAQPFESLSQLLAELDLFTCMAHVSSIQRYIRPTVLPLKSGIIRLTRARHPCLEVVEGASVIGQFIANDVNMEADKSNVQIITGYAALSFSFNALLLADGS